MTLEEERAALDKRVRELTFKLEVRVDDIGKKEVGWDNVLWYMVRDNIMLTFCFTERLKYGAFSFIVQKRTKKNETTVLHNCSGMVRLVNKMTPLRQAVGLHLQIVRYPLESFCSTTVPMHLIVL